MKVTNVQYYSGLDFEEYLKMPGVSFSSLKDAEIPVSAGMQLGTRVHNYLLEPDKYDWEQGATVKKIAEALQKQLGEAYKFLEKEVAFTADFTHNGMLLRYKGRADLLKAGRIVIDLKILSGALVPAIERFGYDNQISGYCLATGADLGLIIAYNKAKNIVETKAIKPSAEFWAYQVVSRGVPIIHLNNDAGRTTE